MSLQDLMSNVLSGMVAYFSTVWTYFSTHWWLGLLFVVYHILIWQHKTKVDQTNVYYKGRTKGPRTVTGVAARALKNRNLTIKP